MSPALFRCAAFLLSAIACAALAQPSLGVLASSYPAKAIKLVVPFTARSASDILARIVGEQGGTPFMECAQSVGIDLPLKALVWEDARSGSATTILLSSRSATVWASVPR